MAENMKAEKSDYFTLEDKIAQFIHYMKTQTLTLEVYDSDSGFLFGLAKLPLSYLSLQHCEGPSALVQKALELDICDTTFSSTLGHLQVSLSNHGSFTLFSKADDMDHLLRSTCKSWYTTNNDDDLSTQAPPSRPKTPKKKKVLSTPIEQIDPNMVTEKLSKIQEG